MQASRQTGLSKPLLVFDGNCSFCRLWIERWKPTTGSRVDYAPFQALAGRFPDIPLENFKRAVQLIEPSGRVFSAAHAVCRLLACSPGRGWMLALYERVPGFAPVAEFLYRWVARNRNFLYSLTVLLWGERFERPRYDHTRQIFFAFLSLAYFFAFLSFATQITGLIGSSGILPARELLESARSLGAQRFLAFPTLAWLGSSDASLRLLCWGGVLLALLALAGFLPVVLFSLLWVLYTSLVTIGQDFLSFQWDILLLEAGFLAILFAATDQVYPRLVRRHAACPADPVEEPSRAVLWLLRFLLFRLMFSSGAVKLASGDPTWRDLTAMEYHYETQPLPTPVGWFAFHLPAAFQKISTVFLFAIELAVPFLIFLPRRVRFLGAFFMIGLQVLIVLTGNYAFFNLLTVGLCLLLFDDQFWMAHSPRWLRRRLASPGSSRPQPVLKRVFIAVAFPVILLGGVVQLAGILGVTRNLSPAASELAAGLARFHIVESYGLFAVMATSRPEIIVEGSNDGEHWQEYQFRYKPGNLKRAPPVIEPFQPRLDWQMWFAALGDYRGNPWFVNFLVRLLQGRPDVLSLLAYNPFPGAPPRFIRAVRYDYTFSSLAAWRATGDWWQKNYTGLYFPVASLRAADDSQ